MATIINNPDGERVVERDSGASAGWAVAVIILLIIIAGGIYYFTRHGAAPAQNGSANINVTVPAPGNSGGTSGGTTGGAGSTQY